MKKAKTLYLTDDQLKMIEQLIENKLSFNQFFNLIIDEFLKNKKNLKRIENSKKSLSDNVSIKKTIRLKSNEVSHFIRIAKQNRSSFSKEVRKAILSNMTRKPVLSLEEKQTLRSAENQLRKVGVNLNQIAKWYNIKKELFVLNDEQNELFILLLEKISKEFDSLKEILINIYNNII